MRCSACGVESAAEAKFCQECGARLGRVCPRCGHAPDAAARFCPACGEPLASEPPPDSPRAYTP